MASKGRVKNDREGRQVKVGVGNRHSWHLARSPYTDGDGSAGAQPTGGHAHTTRYERPVVVHVVVLLVVCRVDVAARCWAPRSSRRAPRRAARRAAARGHAIAVAGARLVVVAVGGREVVIEHVGLGTRLPAVLVDEVGVEEPLALAVV